MINCVYNLYLWCDGIGRSTHLFQTHLSSHSSKLLLCLGPLCHTHCFSFAQLLQSMHITYLHDITSQHKCIDVHLTMSTNCASSLTTLLKFNTPTLRCSHDLQYIVVQCDLRSGKNTACKEMPTCGFYFISPV